MKKFAYGGEKFSAAEAADDVVRQLGTQVANEVGSVLAN